MIKCRVVSVVWLGLHYSIIRLHLCSKLKQKAEYSLQYIKVSRSDDRPTISFKYLYLTKNIRNLKLRQKIQLKEKQGELLKIIFFMYVKQQGTASNNLSIHEKSLGTTSSGRSALP